jgi:putative transcriptional regulator
VGGMKKRTPEQRRELRVALYDELDTLTLAEAVKRMREVTGMTQGDFAARIAGISKPALANIERGAANPTVATLERIGKAFGLDVGFRRKPRTDPPARGSAQE